MAMTEKYDEHVLHGRMPSGPWFHSPWGSSLDDETRRENARLFVIFGRAQACFTLYGRFPDPTAVLSGSWTNYTARAEDWLGDNHPYRARGFLWSVNSCGPVARIVTDYLNPQSIKRVQERISRQRRKFVEGISRHRWKFTEWKRRRFL